MKAMMKIPIGLAVATVLLLAGCPSPFGGFNAPDTYETTATIDTERMVFVEEDGTETPLLTAEDGGPEEIVDFTVVDDSGVARNSGSGNHVRVVILGRRHGRIAVWVLYRYGGMIVLPNEDNTDTQLMEMVEAESWGLDGWEYDTRDIALSKDGKVIIGQYYRPGGWEFADQLGEVPDPAIGVWWSLYEKECYSDDGEIVRKLVVSRARPMILMNEPTAEESIARHSGTRRGWDYNWFYKIIRYITERITSTILNDSWNFMADVEGFVDAADVAGGIPEGFYVAKGVDRDGVASRVWFTTASMEDIIEAPDTPPVDPPPGNSAPWPITGPAAKVEYHDGDTIVLEVTDGQDNVITDPTLFDPDIVLKGDSIEYLPMVVDIAAGGTIPEVSVTDGLLSIEWLDGNLFKSAEISVTLIDSYGAETAALRTISVLFVP